MPDHRPLSEITAEALGTLAEIGHGTNCRYFRGGECNCGYQATGDLLAELSARLDGAVVLTAEEAEDARKRLWHTAPPEEYDDATELWLIPLDPATGKAKTCADDCRACELVEALCGRPGKEKE